MYKAEWNKLLHIAVEQSTHQNNGMHQSALERFSSDIVRILMTEDLADVNSTKPRARDCWQVDGITRPEIQESSIEVVLRASKYCSKESLEKNLSMIQFLLEAEADIYAEDNCGNSIIHNIFKEAYSSRMRLSASANNTPELLHLLCRYVISSNDLSNHEHKTEWNDLLHLYPEHIKDPELKNTMFHILGEYGSIGQVSEMYIGDE